MSVVVFGGTGFVGLNVVERLLLEGRTVTAFDRRPLPALAAEAFAAHPGRLRVVTADLADADTVAAAVADARQVVYAAAVTADAARDAREPRRIFEVNVLGLVTVLEAARRAGVARVVALSSSTAYGETAFRDALLDEAATVGDPRTLYGLSKFTGERTADRLGDLWGLDVVSLRLSSVFGPWERATGVRDTLSPPYQILRRALAGERIRLERADPRDWIYVLDVARGVARVLDAERLQHRLYNLTVLDEAYTLLDWTRSLANVLGPLDVAVAAEPGEINVWTHMPADRGRLSRARLAADVAGFEPFGCAASAEHYALWTQARPTWFEG